MRNTPNTLFPTLSSTEDARNYAMSMLPITSANDANVALNVYHNTLLDQVSQQAQGTYSVTEETLKYFEDFKMMPTPGHENEFALQRLAYNQAIDHITAFFKVRLGA
jgi:hypothetical protein